MEAILRIFFFGLMAFVPNNPDVKRPTELTVVLLDARHPPLATDGCPIHAHRPALYYEPARLDQCLSPCEVVDGLCRCDLDREQICLPQDPQAVSRCETDPALCNYEAFEYVPQMKRVNRKAGRIQETCLKRDPCGGHAGHVPGAGYGGGTAHAHAESDLHALLAGRMTFKLAGLEVCKLSDQDIGPHGQFSAREFNFLPITNRKFMPNDQQLAEIMAMSARVKLDPSEPGLVKLGIKAFDGMEEHTVELRGCMLPFCSYDLVIANVATLGPLDHAYGRCQHGIDRDFELYHDLAAKRVRLYHRGVPRGDKPEEMADPMAPVMCDSSLLDVFLLHYERSATGRPVCPQVTFSPSGP